MNENKKVIGEAWIYLIEKNRMAKMALRIANAYQGRGFATEAAKTIIDFCFTYTELQRIWTDLIPGTLLHGRFLKSAVLLVRV